MAWYKTGTVAVTNASTTVTGAGTNFVSGAQVGDGFLGPNELLYEITAINSATSLTIAPAYGGATASSQSYAIAPTQGLVATLASDVTDLITDYQSVVDNAGAGKFGDGSAASPAIRFTNDQDTGFFRDTANEIAFATAGVKRGEFRSSGIQLLDGQKFIAGTGNDLSIFHNGSTSLIEDNGTGGITLRSDIFTVQNAAGTETVAQFVQDGFVKLFHNNSQVFTTLSSGANITGSLAIGTSTPRTGLHLYGAGQSTSAISDAGSLDAFLRVSDTGAAGGAGGGVVFGTNASEADGFAGFAAIKGLLANGNDRTIGGLAFSMRASTTDTALSERMRLTSDGKLGIGGTASVTTAVTGDNVAPKLIVEGTTATSIAVLRQDTSIVSGNSLGSLGFYGTDTTSNTPTPLAAVQALASGTHAAGDNPTDLRFLTTPDGSSTMAERMRISGRNVGIGTNLPSSTLHLKPSVDSTNGGLRLESEDGSQYATIDMNNAGNLRFYQNGTSRMRLDASGNVGISSSSPTSLGTGITTLELKGNSASQTDRSGGIRFERYDGTYAGAIFNADGAFKHDSGAYPMLFVTNSSEKMRIHTSAAAIVSIGKTSSGTAGQGMVLIGNPSSPQQYFNKSYSGSINGVLFYHSDSYVGGINYSNTSTVFATSSDYRLKTDVQPMTNASARVQALNPVNFEWISEGTRVDGFLAHEAQAVVPEAVTGEKDAVGADGNPEYQGIDQSKLVPLLTAALQEALTKIDALENRITALEG